MPRLLRSGIEDIEADVFGTFVSADISGFTRVSERLEAIGREGAEVMSLALDERFGALVDALQQRGGDVLFFGGDALFAMFAGTEHEWRAVRAAVDLQRIARKAALLTVPGGAVRLRMSLGLHTGTATPVVGGQRHRSFFLIGPTIDRVLSLEASAGAGEILLSTTTARALDPRWVTQRDEFLSLRTRIPEPPTPRQIPSLAPDGAERFISPPLRSLLAAEKAPHEHRLISVAFARLGGLARLDPLQRAARVRRWCRDLDEVTESTGTILLATDVRRGAAKATVVAGIPHHSARDEDRAVNAGLELVARNPSVAVGVNTGQTFVGDVGHATRRTYMILGDSVNVAARAMAAARLGEVLVTDAVARTTEVGTVGRRRRVRAKGKREPLVLARVTGATVLYTDSIGPPLVGRAREMAQIAEVLNANPHAVVEIVGDGGLGRSRLIEETLARVERDPIVRIDARVSLGTAPFAALNAPFRELCGVESAEGLRRLPRRLPIDLRAEYWLLAAVLGFEGGAAAHHPPEVTRVMRAEMLAVCLGYGAGALILDDADSLDPASLALLRELVPRLSTRGWTVLASRRPAGRSIANAANAVRLRPLSKTAIRRIAISTCGASLSERRLREVVERAAGNPLFATELSHNLASAPLSVLPRAAQLRGGALVDTLPASDRTLLREVAALGESIELNFAAEVIGDENLVTPQPWEPLRRFVSLGPNATLSFRSETIRLAAYEGLPYSDRRRLHTRAMKVLERRRSSGEPILASVLARHAELAGLETSVARWAPIAAQDAQMTGAAEDAASFWTLALAAAIANRTRTQIARVAEACGDANERLGEVEAARVAYRRAARSVQPLDRARLAWKTGRVELRVGDLSAARSAATRGLHALTAADSKSPKPLAVRLLLLRAAVHCFADRRGPSLRDGQTAMSIARELDDDELIGDAAIHLEMEYGERGDPRQQEYGVLAVELLEPRGPTVELGTVLGSLGLARMFVGDWTEALACYERAARIFELCGHVVGRLSTEINRLGIVVEQGHLKKALDTIDDLGPASTSAPRWFSQFLLATRGRAIAFGGQPDMGARTIRTALRGMRENAPERIIADTECYLLEALVLNGNTVPALRLGGSLVATLDRVAPNQVVAISARRLLAVAHYQNQSRNPYAELEDSLRLARETGAFIEVARTLGVMSSINEARGDEVPSAWDRERSAILASHGVVFEPSFPLFATVRR